MKIAVLGHGTVGSGVAEILTERKTEVSAAAEKEIELGAVLDIKNFSGLSYSDKFVTDYSEILDDPEIGIVAEAIGGTEPAFSYIKSALKKGKSVVTSNKELVAEKGAELLSIARAHNVNFLFEASVGGAIPVIRSLYTSLNATGITEIAGILNGTTNYILTKMFREGQDYFSALADAQKLGYAESDPSADVLGFDAQRKIAILSSLVWGSTLHTEDIPTEGITNISAKDVYLAEKCGFSIKLIARAKRLENGKIFARVSPALVKKDSVLANVNDVFNAVLIKSETAGKTVLYGKGAGKLPTASAVVADIIECAKADGNIKSVFWQNGAQNTAADKNSHRERYFIRTLSKACFMPKGTDEIEENAYITPPLTEKELFMLEEKADEHCRFISKIPLFE
ncbi:MAG: homoserine dehydrogenase [Oscillospiraceae bacterium]|nr:homoserine dehydrogenase [Oscillospiraceae bacterium]